MDSRKIGLRRKFDREVLVHLETVLRVAVCTIEDSFDAEEAVQKSFVKAYRSFDLLEDGVNYRKWLFGIFTGILYSEYNSPVRRTGSLVFGEAGDDFLYEQLSEDDGLVREEEEFFAQIGHDDIQAGVWQLPEDLRLIVALKLLGKLSYSEISDVTGFPTGTVRSRLRQGRELLARVLWDLALCHGCSGVAEAVTEQS